MIKGNINQETGEFKKDKEVAYSNFKVNFFLIIISADPAEQIRMKLEHAGFPLNQAIFFSLQNLSISA